MKKFEPWTGASRLSHPRSRAGKLQGDASQGDSNRFRMLALAITLLAVATFGILYTAAAQNSDGAITGLTLSGNSPGTLAVSWDPSSPDPTDYRVNWAKSDKEFPSWTSDNGNLYPTATSVDLTSLDPGVEYKVRVRARYWDGDDADTPWSGPWAQESLQVAAEEPPEPEATPPATPEPEATPEPGTLGNVTTEDTGDLGLLISWQAPAEPHDQPTDYRVNWGKSSEEYPSWTSDDGNLYPTTTSMGLTDLDPGIEYKIRVRARYWDGDNLDSPWGGLWTEITAQVTLPLPQAPNIMGTLVSPEGEVTLMLQDPSDDSITGYQVLRGPDDNNLAVIKDDTASATTRYTDPSPTTGQTHTYAVRARNALGSSPRSNTVTATVPKEEEEEEPLIPAQQNSESGVLFSNFHKDYGDLQITQRVNTSIYRFAHSFRAANYWDGSTAEFDFTGITILMDPAIEGHMNALLVTVHADADSGDEPGELLHTLGTPTPQSGGDYPPVLYSAPEGSTLSSGVTYWVKLDTTADSEFFMNYGIAIRKATDGQEQGQATINRWKVNDEGIQSKRQTPNTWEPVEQGLAMRLQGEQRFQVLVSTMHQPPLSNHGMSALQMEAQSFTTRPGEMGLAYSFVGIRMVASSASSANIGIALHKDNKGTPGTRLFSLNTPPNYSHGPSEFRDYFAFAPRGSRLEAGHRYWVLFRNHNPDIFEIRLTDSRGEDNDSVPGVTMGDRRYIRPDGEAWQHTALPMRMMIMGQELLPTAHEAGWPDLPGNIWTATTTNGVVTEDTVSTGHLTAGLDRNHGLTGDYWYLDTQPGHDYRVEVKFGNNPNVSTGGSAGTNFNDRDEDHDFVSSCCESDHNREDGATFFHFIHPEKESNSDYMVKVAMYDHYNGSLSHTYNGPYEITLTDITGIERMIYDLYEGTTVSSDEVLNASATNKGSLAMRFQTGGHAAGYTLDRIRVRSHDKANRGAVPEIAMHQDSSSSPGTKLCDIAVPNRIMEEPIMWISSLIHTYLAPDCADDVLASSSHYWIVFSGLDHADYTLAYATSDAENTDLFGKLFRVEGK